MSHEKVVVSCSLGFREQPFKSRDAAQRWIDEFERARRHDDRLCQGEHTIAEETSSAD